jgi:putative endonuclease
MGVIMFSSRQQFGFNGERLAEEYLLKLGFTVVARNFRTREGEIDLICRDGKTLVFVEVKTRRSNRFGAPEEAVTYQKLRRLRTAAFAFLVEHPARAFRFDVIAIDASVTPPIIRQISGI